MDPQARQSPAVDEDFLDGRRSYGVTEFWRGDVMKFPHSSSQAEQPGKSKGKVAQIGAVAGLMILSFEALHMLAPASLVLLQLFLDVCQACVTILRIRGV